MQIIPSKLMTPDGSPCLLRHRLFEFLCENHHRSLITITSEGGYGKTTLVSSYIKQHQVDSLWYRLDASDRHPQTFLAYLKEGLQPFLAKVNLYLDGDDEHPELEMKALTSALAVYPERLIIVLDNYHELNDQEEITSWMMHFLESASPFVTFILIGRVKPSLPLVNLKLKQQLAELKTKDLAFNQQEIMDYLSSFCNLHLPVDELQVIFRKTEGWISSLVLLVDVIRQMEEGERKYFLTHFSMTEDIYSYLASEVLSQQPEELQQFLFHTCLLDELDSSVINKYLAVEHAADTLEHLLRQHLFISKDHKGFYRYHYLFRAFLYQRMKKEIDESELRAKHIHLAKIYETHHSLLQAFAHYTWGKDYIQAARLMRVMIKRFQPKLFLSIVDGLLEALTPEHTLAHTSLFIFRCVPLSILEELIPVFERNMAGIEGEDRSMLTHLQHRLGNIHFYRGDLNRCLELFEASLQGAIKSYDFGTAALNYSLISQVYRFMGNEQKAIDYARESLSHTERYPIPPQVKMNALWNLAEVCIFQNDFTYAEALLQEAISVSEHCDEASKAFPYSSMGKIYRLQGRFEEAIEWGEKAVEHASRFQIEPDLGWTSLELGITYLYADQLESAEQSLSESRRYFARYTHLHQLVETWREEVEKKKNRPGKKPRTLRIKLLGNLDIRTDDYVVKIPRKSSLRLLLLLLIHRGKKLTRDYIIEELFPDDSLDTVQNKFYVSLSILRKALEPDLDSGRKSSFIRQEGEQVFLSTEKVSVDVDEFLQAADSRSLEGLLQAESLYEDDLLLEFPYESFLEAERERLRNYYLSVLEKLGEYYAAHHQVEKSVPYFEKILQKDPFRDAVYLQYLELLLKSRLYSQAKQLYEKGRKYLEEDLGLDIDRLFKPLLIKYQCPSFQVERMR